MPNYIITHKSFDFPGYGDNYSVITNRDNILFNGRHVEKTDFGEFDDRVWSEVAGMLNVPTDEEWYVFNHYDRKLDAKEGEIAFSKPIVQPFTNAFAYAIYHNTEDFWTMNEVLKAYPEYSSYFYTMSMDNHFVPYNMFSLPQKEYLEWRELILNVVPETLHQIAGGIDYKSVRHHVETHPEYTKGRAGQNGTVEYQTRIAGELTERLTNVFLLKKLNDGLKVNFKDVFILDSKKEM